MIKGVKSENIIKLLKEEISIKKRNIVKEITVDMANNMNKIALSVFPKTTIVTDRFHVQKLVIEALQEMRIKLRWEVINEENKAIKKAKEKKKKYYSKTYENGDTKKQLLARSRYLLFKPKNKWIASQKKKSKNIIQRVPKFRKCIQTNNVF